MSLLVSSLFTPLLKIILPVFALILAGYACRKTNRLGPNASSELNRFVVYLALPALLFDIMATTPWHTLDQPAFIAAFGLGAGGIFLLTAMIRLKQSRHLAGHGLPCRHELTADVKRPGPDEMGLFRRHCIMFNIKNIKSNFIFCVPYIEHKSTWR